MPSLKEEMEVFTGDDPYRAVRLIQSSILVQSVGALAAAGAPLDEIRECFESAVTHARAVLASVDQSASAGQNLDRVLSGKPKIIV